MKETDHGLIIRSPWYYHPLYLFCCSHHVSFQRATRQVTIRHRRWWFFTKRQTISYDDVEEVGFVSKNIPDFGCGDPFWGDRYEIVWLALQLRHQDDFVRLAPFEGEGSKETGILGVLLGDSIIDFRGDHADAAYNARYFVKRELRSFISPPHS